MERRRDGARRRPPVPGSLGGSAGSDGAPGGPSSLWSRLSGWQQLLAALVAAIATLTVPIIAAVLSNTHDTRAGGSYPAPSTVSSQPPSPAVAITRFKRVARPSPGQASGLEPWHIEGRVSNSPPGTFVYVLAIYTLANSSHQSASTAPAKALLFGPAYDSSTGSLSAEKDGSTYNWALDAVANVPQYGEGLKFEAALLDDQCPRCLLGLGPYYGQQVDPATLAPHAQSTPVRATTNSARRLR